MAKLSDKKDKLSFINDDTIKDALKTGLSSIQTSDELVRKTLANCQSELDLKKYNQKIRSVAFMPWVFKLGAPLAAGALVMVLALNGNQLISRDKYTASAPQESNATSSFENGGAFAKSAGKDEESLRSSALPEIAFSEAGTPSEAPASKGDTGDMSPRITSDAMTKYAYGSLQAINSLPNRSPNDSTRGHVETIDAFNGIVSQYNTTNGTQLSLEEAGVTRIQTLVQSGVNADMLLNVKSYRDIVSDEGYWALPLKNAQGVMEGLLSVNAIDDRNPNMTISSNDLLYSYKQEEFIASTNPQGAFVYKNCELMFDADGLVTLIEAKGYKTVSETIVVDINYGMDFIVFAEADGQELSIPFLTNESLFGLENSKIYARDELFNILSEHIQP